MVAGFSLPKADAMRLAQAILIACSSDGAKKVSAVPLRGIERKRSLIGWKMVFDAAKEEGEDEVVVQFEFGDSSLFSTWDWDELR
jgi:hypothetical protein